MKSEDYINGYENGKAEENKEWREGRRCEICGAEKFPNQITMCDDCLETQ